MSERNATRYVIDLLRREKPGILLDLPSGGGELSRGAKELGHKVVEVDLFPRPDLDGVLADACAPLPFHDESFDSLVCMEGIEHFENQTGFLRECARVLKPGGLLVLTTPNILHLGSRVAAFLTGQRLLHQGIINEVSTLRTRSGARLYHGHAYLIDVFRMRYIMRVVGLKLEQLECTSLSSSSIALAPLVPAVWLATRLSLSSGRKRLERMGRRAPPPDVEDELARLAVSKPLLFGKKVIAVARKERAQAGVARPALAGV